MIDSLRLPLQSHRQILLLLLALTLIRGSIYASLTPPWWQGHDEEFHFAQIKLLADQWFPTSSPSNPTWTQEMAATLAIFPQGRWGPNPEDQIDIATPPVRYEFFGRPSLSYYPYVWLDQWLFYQDILLQLFALRFISVIITSITVIIAFLCSRELFKESPLSQILVPWLIIFNPAFMITGSTVTDANLAILLAALIFYLILLEITEPYQWWRIPLALLLTIPALGAKATTYFLLPVWGVLLIPYLWKWGRKHWYWLGVVLALFIVVFILLTKTPRFIEWITLLQTALQQRGLNAEAFAYAFSFTFFWDNFIFFWIILGWSTYRLTQVWYLLLFLFFLLILLGWLRYGWRQFRGFTWGVEQKSLLLALLFVGVSVAILFGVGLIRYKEQDGRSARYIFPIIIPLSILLVTGWRELLPASWRNTGLVALATIFFLFDTLVWLDFALPWYFPFWPN